MINNISPSISLKYVSILFAILLSQFIPFHSSYCNEISILYWNNRQAHSLPETKIINGESVEAGGIATLAGMVDVIRSISPQTLTFVVGNALSGSAVAAKTSGLSEIELLNLIGIDAFTPGVRGFGFGVRPLLKSTKKAKFPILLGNCTYKYKKDISTLFTSDSLFEKNGVKVAVVGLIDDRFTELVAPDGIAGLSTFNPKIAAIDFIMDRRSSCDLLVALTYMGWHNDSLLAATVDGFDLIIGSGDYDTFDPPREVNGVVITQAGAYGHQLGRLVIDVDTAQNRIRSYNNEIMQVQKGAALPNEKVAQLVDKQRDKHLKELERDIGFLETDWEYSADGQSNLSQWVADMTRYIEPRAWASIIDNRDVQKGLKQGNISELNMWEICPFENILIVFRITGTELMDMVQNQLNKDQLNYTWGGIKLKADGKKIISLTIKDEMVSANSYYLVTTTGSVWERLESSFGIDPNDRPSFPLPGINQRDKLIEAVTNLRLVGSPLDDRWEVKK